MKAFLGGVAFSFVIASAAAAQDGVGVWRSDELASRDAVLARGIRADGSARETLADYEHHRFRFIRRDADGRPEQHDRIVDVVFVHSGRGTLLVGGRMLNASGSAVTGEYLGTGIEGGVRHELGPGDVVHVPAGLPHSFLVPEGEHLTYVLVKFPAPEASPAQP